MTEEQKKRKAERDRRYREKKKLEKAAEADMQAPVDPAPESAMQAPVDPSPESAMQSPSVMELMEGQERYREEFKGVPVKPERELTPFELLKRRRERYS